MPKNDSIKAGYETSDMKVNIIVGSLTALLVVLIAGVAICIVIMRGFDHANTPAVPPSALAGEVSQVPGEPRLQQDPVLEKEQILGEARARLNGYGILSDEPGVERAHIPIERAMALVASGAVPYRQEPTDATVDAGEVQ